MVPRYLPNDVLTIMNYDNENATTNRRCTLGVKSECLSREKPTVRLFIAYTCAGELTPGIVERDSTYRARISDELSSRNTPSFALCALRDVFLDFYSSSLWNSKRRNDGRWSMSRGSPGIQGFGSSNRGWSRARLITRVLSARKEIVQRATSDERRFRQRVFGTRTRLGGPVGGRAPTRGRGYGNNRRELYFSRTHCAKFASYTLSRCNYTTSADSCELTHGRWSRGRVRVGVHARARVFVRSRARTIAVELARLIPRLPPVPRGR